MEKLLLTMDEKEGSMELPVFGYKGYHITDESEKVYVDFYESWYCKMAEMISVIWLCFIVTGIIYLHKA